MPRTLILLRHSKSDWPENVPDFERPLAGRGRRDAPAAGRWLAEHVSGIGLVLCSPAKRARQTWKRVSVELPETPPVRFEPRLYGEGVPAILDMLREVPEDVSTVLLVAHNPDLSQLAEQLTGTAAELRTSSIAVIDSGAQWRGSLRILVTPRG